MQSDITQREIDRFWEKIDKTGDCWIWTAAKTNKGYGKLTIRRRTWIAHRFAFTITHGMIPSSAHVLHRCDNPPCCNPDHLFLGSNDDNIRDRIAKWRGRKLSKGQEAQAAQLYANGATYRDIQEMFKISRAQVWRLLHKTGSIQHRVWHNFVLTSEQEAELSRKYATGLTQTELAQEYDIGISTVHYILKRSR